jgi:recombination protein RecT
MAVKTMLRQLLSKWGVMSLEMQKAEEADGAAITASGEIEYIDSPDADPQPMPAAPQTVEAPAEPEPDPDPDDEDDEPLDDFASIMEG